MKGIIHIFTESLYLTKFRNNYRNIDFRSDKVEFLPILLDNVQQERNISYFIISRMINFIVYRDNIIKMIGGGMNV